MQVTLMPYAFVHSADLVGLVVRANGADLDMFDPHITPFTPGDPLDFAASVECDIDDLRKRGVIGEGEQLVFSLGLHCGHSLFRGAAHSNVVPGEVASVEARVPAGYAADGVEVSLMLSKCGADAQFDAESRVLWTAKLRVGLGGSLSQPVTLVREFADAQSDALWRFHLNLPVELERTRVANQEQVLTIEINWKHHELIDGSPDLQRLMASELLTLLVDWTFALDPVEREHVLEWCSQDDDPVQFGTFIHLVRQAIHLSRLQRGAPGIVSWSADRFTWHAEVQAAAARVVAL